MSSATTNTCLQALNFQPGQRTAPVRALAGLYGALLGDALGVPHEFKAAWQLPPLVELCLVMPPTYAKTYNAIPYGTWSDDGSQIMALADVICQARGHYDEAAFIAQLLAWYQSGRHQAGGLVFDCGGQTSVALAHHAAGKPWGVDPRALGNGALMRVLPAAVLPPCFGRSAQEAVQAAMDQSAATHPQPLSVVTCGLYAQLALELEGAPPSWQKATLDAAARLRQHPAMTKERLVALDELFFFRAYELPTGTGYVANTFWSAIRALEQSTDYLGAVRAAIALGNDTDTTACVTGGLAALAWGLSSVPAAWWDSLTVPAESQAVLAQLAA